VNILVVKPSSLGDVIHAFPAVHLLRQSFPDASISWVVNDSYAELVELCPDVDEVLLFCRSRWAQPRYWWQALSFLRELRQKHFDLAIDLQGLFRSAVLAFSSGAARRIGFADAREGAPLLYTEKILLPANVKHAVDRNLFLVRSALKISAEPSIPGFLSHHDAVKCAENLMRRRGLAGDGPVLAVAPAARWESKAWPPEFFAGVISSVHRRVPGLQCWILGTEDEQAVGEAVIGACQGTTPVSLMGEANLSTLVELLRRSDVLLTNDSGPMHLAAALRTRTVALFGPTDPELTGPYGDQHRVFVGKCDKAPCFLRRCPREKCECIDSLTEDGVAEAVAAMLLGGDAATGTDGDGVKP
jgi:lipopolysaccharide heptosyltransferase I